MICPPFVTQSESKMCQRLSMHLSPLMRDSLRRSLWLSAPLILEVMELNFPHISRLRRLSALLCCRERLSDYRTNRGKKWTLKSTRFSCEASPLLKCTVCVCGLDFCGARLLRGVDIIWKSKHLHDDVCITQTYFKIFATVCKIKPKTEGDDLQVI